MEGYTYGPGLGEPARLEVCVHNQPLGWSCLGCAREQVPPKTGTAPAHRATPPRFVERAVCNHCGSRIWVDEQAGVRAR